MTHLGTLGTNTASTSVDNLAITLTGGAPVGSTVLVGLAWESAAGTVPTISSAVDSRGNTYTTTPDTSANAGTTVAVAVLRARVTTELLASDTITVTISGETRSRWAMQADAFDDVDASPLDKTASNTPGSASALSSGVTAATIQAYELVYAVFGFGSGRTVTLDPGWTGGPKVESSAGSGDRGLQVIHKYVSSVGTQEGTISLSSSSTYAGAVATYTATSLAPPEARISQVKLEAPLAEDALLAKVSQVAFETPQGTIGEVRVSRASLTVPSKAGQPPYSGVKAARAGDLWDATISSPATT